MSQNVYTYYMPVPGLWSEDSQRALLSVWARSWKKQGWNPVILNEGVAKRHPRYREFKKSYWELPTEYGHDYEGACFMRYVAMSAVGGGMMVDYDVINYGFKPVKPDPTKFYCIDERMDPKCMSTGCCIAPASLFEGMCQIFHTWKLTEHDWNPNAKPAPMYHVSDLTVMNQLFDGRKEKPEWLQLRPGCGVFPHPVWKTAPLAHYCYAMHAAGYWPKHEWIEKIRPF